MISGAHADSADSNIIQKLYRWGGVGCQRPEKKKKVAFLEEWSKKVAQNHSHRIRLEKLVCLLTTPHRYVMARTQNINKPLKKRKIYQRWLGHPPESTTIHNNQPEPTIKKASIVGSLNWCFV